MDQMNQLNKQEVDWYNKIKEGCLIPQQKKACELCLNYFIDYKKAIHHNHVPSQKVHLALKCAYFLAQKSQLTINMRGQSVRGISFSVNKLLKDFMLDDTMCMLKDYQRCVKIQDKETNNYLINVIKELSFLNSLHSKLIKTIEKLFPKESQAADMTNSTYFNLFKSYAWLMFIEIKNKVLKKSLQLVENTFMIACILSWMVILAWDYLKSDLVLNAIREKRANQSDFKIINRTIKEKIMEMFRLKDVTEFKNAWDMFDEYFNNNAGVIVAKMKSEKDLLSPANIQDNYRKLDKLYMKSIDPHELDERIFAKQRANNFTPTKFTPFVRQGYLNKFQKPTTKLSGNIVNPNKEQNFTSHRILNYQQIQKQIQIKNIPTHQIKLPKNIMQSPSMVKAPLIFATPMTAAMEMVNYLKEKITRKYNITNSNFTKSFDQRADHYITTFFSLQGADFDQKTKARKQQQVLHLFKILAEELMDENFEQNKNQMFKSCLALSAQIVFFVYNEQVEFNQIQEVLDVKPFQMWITLSCFMKSDKNIPTPLRLHILDLQVDIISYKLWKEQKMIEKLACAANANYSKYTEHQIFQIQKLFKRVLHQIAFQITRLSPPLGVDEGSSQAIFQTMKLILISHSDLLKQRHIDQLIMCAFYVMGRVKNLSLKFGQIQLVFKQINPNLKDIFQDLIANVYINEETPESNIISFYNKIFIKREDLKDFMVSFSDSHSAFCQHKNNKKNVVLLSPLKAIIPKEISFKGHNANKNKGNMTPQTQLLYAYNESPILKYEVNAFRGPLKSKKTLNFEEEQERSRQASEQIGGRVNTGIYLNKPSTPQNIHQQNTATNDFINKKFVRNKCALQKQNLNVCTPSNSHRSLFDTTDRKEGIVLHGGQKNDETWYKGKNSQMGPFK